MKPPEFKMVRRWSLLGGGLTGTAYMIIVYGTDANLGIMAVLGGMMGLDSFMHQDEKAAVAKDEA